MSTATRLSLKEMGESAKAASRKLALLTTREKNAALHAIADEIEASVPPILEANSRDLSIAMEKGTTSAFLDRLRLTEERISALAHDTRSVASLPDPVHTDIECRTLENGIRLHRRRIPIGVLGVIYEARPNVTIDIAALSLKTGNAALLRGGTETLHSNLVLTSIIQNALSKTRIPASAIQYLDSPDRALVTELLQLDAYVDMIIPRGGAGLHRLCKEKSTIPVITGGIGICHLFVDESADLERAVDIVENAKVQRPSVCNALDTVLVHRNIADHFLPQMAERLTRSDVELRVDEGSYNLLEKTASTCSYIRAESGDFDQEWLSLVLGVKIVEDVEEAVDHIHQHSTEHSDSILTENEERASYFVDAINSAAVYVNASTRFTDGGQFGLGAEVAVSTQKLHARGPMGLEALTTYKWIGYGTGQIRS